MALGLGLELGARVAGGLRGWLRGRGFAELASSGVEETEAVMKPG